ncbi:MAG TPA: type II secretion system F family protein [Alphaproteobacteria bacterium]|nr:type II secretion system F family protein [Alphaproteobacteria bacterium]
MALFAEEFGKAFIFKNLRPKIRGFFLKAGYDDVPYDLFGYLFFASLGITYLIFIILINPIISNITTSYAIIPAIITFISWATVQIVVLFLMIMYLYFSLNIKIYQRTKEIEFILPDYLQVVSANLKGGLSFEKAMWAAIKPEFGIIAKEITMVYKKVMTGNDLNEALEEFMEKYESPIMRRSFDLIIGEVESGGEIAIIVDKVVENIRKTKSLKEEMSASTLTYMIFIAAIVIIIAPGLFALSFYLLQIMIGFSSQLSNLGPNMPISFSGDSMNPADYKIFSVTAILMVSLFSALIMSLIEKGDIRGGLKYIPAFMISSIIFYYIFIAAFGYFFGGIGGGTVG